MKRCVHNSVEEIRLHRTLKTERFKDDLTRWAFRVIVRLSLTHYELTAVKK